MKRVISFSLYGDSPKYRIGMLKNIELAKTIYPGWVVRVYADMPNVSWLINKLNFYEDPQQIHLFVCDHRGLIPGMMWRFLVADDPTVERFIVRDCDSRLSEREARACDEWIADDTIGWILRDHPAHAQPMMGGLWGAMWRRSNWAAPKMREMITNYLKSPRPYHTGDYADDQLFLQTRIWPWIKNSCTQHDSVCRNAYPGARPFPTKRDFPRFCGEVFDEHDNPREGDYQQIKKEE